MSQIAMLLPETGDRRSRTADGLRRATVEDEPRLAALLDAVFPEEPWTTERVRGELTRALDVLDVFVAEVEGRLVATASGRHFAGRFPGAGYVHWVAVDPESRGRGLGLAIVSEVVESLRRHGLSTVILETDDERLPAISTYLSLGFIPLYRESGHTARWSRIFRALAHSRQR